MKTSGLRATARRPLRAHSGAISFGPCMKVDLELPVRDDTLINKQILHVVDLGKGSGLEFVQFAVAAGKQKHHNDPSGVPRPGSWKFKLVSSLKRTELKSLRDFAYGIKGVWYLAQKKPVKKKAAEGKEGGKEFDGG
jgi:hypothetical protein